MNERNPRPSEIQGYLLARMTLGWTIRRSPTSIDLCDKCYPRRRVGTTTWESLRDRGWIEAVPGESGVWRITPAGRKAAPPGYVAMVGA